MDSKDVEEMANCYSYLEMLGFSSKFLGFGGGSHEQEEVRALGFPLVYQAGGSCTDTGTVGMQVVQQMSSESSSISSLSSSPTSTATNGVLSNSSSKHVKKKQERKEEPIRTNNHHASKRAKSSGTIKVRKEKLGERIMALQQLVSPFGKSDTASVLHEALGYIRFLHDQVQVLSSPYLQHLPASSAPFHEGTSTCDLRSRGLCLVPVSCTEHVTSTTGADMWTPAVRNNNK